MLIYNGERYVKAYSRRQKKRVDERLRKSANAERKKQFAKASNQMLNTMKSYEYCSNYYISTTYSK